ncbi:MAG: nickel-dependent hydrogenase large subunit [Methylococcaceae bacterium]|nr:nickel-dependent hydrogenase large subunit [Methylococcaceae bacterium]
MAAQHNVIIDPVTRIEGHLRIQAVAEEVKDASGNTLYHEIKTPGLSSSTMVRGIEIIMKDRDPRDTWAFAQRICGVCTVVHGLTSVRAVEDAIGIQVPANADYIRNLMIGAQYVHDHVMHFYHLHALDWVDVVKALSASPSATAALAKTNNPNYFPNNGKLPDATYFQNVLNQLNGLKARNQLGLFSNAYWGHPAYRLTPEQNLLLVSHYLEALAWAREIVKLHAIFGGRDPHPNLVVGGMPCTLSSNRGPVGEDSGGTSLNDAGFQTVQNVIKKMQSFVDNVYFLDTVLVAGIYKDWANYGATAGNFLCYGEFPDPAKGGIGNPANFLLAQGVIEGFTSGTTALNLGQLLKPFDPAKVTENVTHAWYQYTTASAVDLHPYAGETTLAYDGPQPDQPGYMLDENSKYSWIKSPRYAGKAMEVGPLAHVLMMHARGSLTMDKTVRTLVGQYWTGALKLEFAQLNSTLGRIFSRTLETKLIADAMQGWYTALFNNKSGAYFNPAAFDILKNNAAWAGDRRGFGFTEAPRGALGHWVNISKATGKVANYQCIVASQWNAGPRDGKLTPVPGPYEQALQGHRLFDPKQPLEVLRTIHSFDPCIGCAVHIVDPEGESLIQVNLNHA